MHARLKPGCIKQRLRSSSYGTDNMAIAHQLLSTAYRHDRNPRKGRKTLTKRRQALNIPGQHLDQLKRTDCAQGSNMTFSLPAGAEHTCNSRIGIRQHASSNTTGSPRTNHAEIIRFNDRHQLTGEGIEQMNQKAIP